MAQQTLLKYLNYRRRFPLIFDNLDYNDCKISELLTNGLVDYSESTCAAGQKKNSFKF